MPNWHLKYRSRWPLRDRLPGGHADITNCDILHKLSSQIPEAKAFQESEQSLKHFGISAIPTLLMSKKKALIPVGCIDQLILPVRGQRVILDRDLAVLYGVETRVLNQAVRRNLDRFPDDFMFSLSREEIRNISQTVISSKLKHAPNVFAFTEQGVAMLSSVLNSPRAVQVNIEIMRAFVRLREVLATNRELSQRLVELERKFGTHDKQIQAIFDAIRQLMTPPEPPEAPHKEMGFHIKEDGVPYRIRRRSRRSRAESTV
jgi:hypothetical protein